MHVESTSDGIPVHCAYDAIIPVGDLPPNPRNPNTHPPDQIELLGKLIVAHGWRCPITVSKRSGKIVRGHGRLLAAKRANLREAPVDYQDYDSDELELADLVADNRIAELAEIDCTVLKDLLEELDTGQLDMELTGWTEEALGRLMSAFHVERDSEQGDKSITCPQCGYRFERE